MHKLALGLVITLLATATYAQETNAYKTRIESYEAQTNTVIIKGYGQIGSFSVTSGTVTVRCKEDLDVTHGSKLYGLVVDFSGDGVSRLAAVVDDEELDPLLDGLDYLAKITSSASPMPAFEAGITTKSGLRIEAHSNRRQSGITYQFELDDRFRMPLSTDQVVQLENLVIQSKKYLDELKRAQ